ncbi:NAD(P)/FAD-dependent oxidoreductase [Virgibacillus sp. W0181]|uniref:NAD(P)/FAD-dependent oxidoreductase n=1 Tax=Virgibacillus sp. W0181 TaxID=3391581 RepID=UPI003F45977B
MEQNNIFDVTIIGGGAAGLFAAFYSGLRDMKTKVIEYKSVLGGKMRVYPEKMVWDVGGIPPITGAQLIEQSIQQGLTFDPEVVLNERIDGLTKTDDGTFVLKAASGQKHYSKTVVIAVGSGILDPKKIQIQGKGDYEASNIHYAVETLKDFKDKTVIISGGGNTAIDWANELERICKKVYLIYRKEALDGHEAMIKHLLSSTVEFMPETIISNLKTNDGEQTIVEQVELTKQTTGEKTFLDVDEMIINHGYHRDTSLLKNSRPAINLLDDLYIKGNVNGETSVNGLYAAGDVLRFDGKLELIAGAYQDAANAVNKAKHDIKPDARTIAMVSTHNDKLKAWNRELMDEMLDDSNQSF